MSTDNYEQRASERNLIKSTSLIAVGTLSSRILGFIRDVILAKFFGTGIKADAFFVAFRIPNLFRDLVGEGATNSAFVPIVSEYVHQKERLALWNFISVVFILGLMILSGLTVAGMIFSPFLVRLLAPGFLVDPDKLALTIYLTKVMFPYLILIGLTAYSMGILYTFKSFFTPAFSPCLLNISVILSALISARTMEDPVYGLAIGVLIGGAAQLFVQFRALSKLGVKFVKPATLNHPDARRMGRLLLPRLFGAGVYQLTVFIDTFCASLSFIVGLGGISAIYYSSRVVQLPMGIFSIAMASAVLPTLAEYSAKKEFEHFKKTLVFSLESIFFILLPISVIMMVLATPIIKILFQRGEFNQYSTDITSVALFFYAIGLFSFGGVKIMVTAFHSLQDTKTPVKVAAVCLLINVILNFIFMRPLKVGGIALASSISSMINVVILFWYITKRLGKMRENIALYLLKVFLAASVTGLLVFSGWRYVRLSNDIFKLALVVSSGLIFYAAFCYVLQVEQAYNLFRWARGRLRIR
ncbi:MAG: murein biosynthesis integral membrane protein MurJ [Candidatus Omnitrophota bacterium]